MRNAISPSVNAGTAGPSAVKAILLAGLVAGTLDLSGAITLYAVILDRVTATRLLQSIASGVFGKRAYEGGVGMVICGVVFHYIIAFSFTIGYFLVYPYMPFLRKQRIISGILYGIFVWAFMNLLVLPLVMGRTPPLTFISIVRAAGLLICFIGIPVSLIAHKYYSARNRVLL